MEGKEIVESVVGPMSHSPQSLELFTKTVVDSQPWLRDPKCHPIPWRGAELDDIASGGYEPRRYKGLPVAVQVVGQRLEEERVLGIAQALQKLLKSCKSSR